MGENQLTCCCLLQLLSPLLQLGERFGSITAEWWWLRLFDGMARIQCIVAAMQQLAAQRMVLGTAAQHSR